jgi:hypothetical protein
MRVLTRMLIVLGIGVVLVALAAAILAWQLPSLQGTITIGNGDVTLKGFDDANGDNAGLAMVLAGVAVVGIVLAAVVAVVIGLGAAVLALAAALVVVAGGLVLGASPLLLIGWLVWLVMRPRRTSAVATATIAAS